MNKTAAVAWLILSPVVWSAPYLAQSKAVVDKGQPQALSSVQMDHDEYVQTFLEAGSGLVVSSVSRSNSR